MERYDVVIVGSGIGGLLCAALLSKKGFKVAVFEKQNYPGGLCSSFKKDGYIFDVAVDCIGGLKKGELLETTLKELEIENKLDLISLQPVRRNIFPDFHIDIPSDASSYKEKLKELFYSEKEGLDRAFLYMKEIYEQSMLSVFGGEGADMFKLRKWMGKSFRDLLDDSLTDPRLKAALSSYCTCLGLPSSQVSAIAAANTLMHYTKGGAYRIRGGMQKLPDLLVELIKSNSGKVFLAEKAEKILTKKNRATGIVTEKQRYVMADHVIANIDLKTAVNSMIENSAIEKGKISQLNKLEVSGSFVIVYLGTDIDVTRCNLTSSIGYFSSYDADSMLNRSKDIFLGLGIPSILDDSIAPAGAHNLVIYWPLSEHKNVDKNEIADMLIEKVTHLIPGLSDHIRFLKVADAETIFQYTGSCKGAAYGWKQNSGFYDNIPTLRNILDNFHVVGHWAGLGGGVMPSAISSLRVVKEIAR